MPVCMLCNSLASVEKRCPKCGRLLVDAGLLQDYYDNYSAYLAQDIYEDGYRCSNALFCVHLFACPQCHYDVALKVKKIDEERLMD